ncbi:LysR family hydrogen peroxide-inducible transcriptional activator [Anseongella ginsenosidimutans]|uniref:LysR family hydrogen peroxide-inducible transcriptional activator n=1 Tax=Anseongella ginsenosidimutans TaxID=496056 RepID=A0A4R3KSX4_9SPHI|nr:hydrogen peroxide-inducible genes activator [Anseongella ginsenosidimutans]QEC53266.1 LysR family transcriptional regulator [Anseongella ginsenosidimutans]TCS87906.1 LysR family hydrogen peroxide-inducible transcriptional activator [Anseongella ginsenosidimutans]
MTIVQLEYILAVDTYRNFARAAEKCFVSQPTLSMQLQKLEEELGEKLFDRSKQPVIPTERGLKVIEQARNVLREFQKIPEIIKESRGEVSGELRLGIIPTVAPYLLPLFITDFLEKYPKVSLVIEELVTGEILKRLANDSIDAGIASTPLQEPVVQEIPLYYEPVVAYVSAAHPLYEREWISSSELETQDLWTLGEGHCFRSQVVNLCRKSPAKNEAGSLEYQNGSMEFLARLADMTGKITLLPEMATYGWPEERKRAIRPMEGRSPVREISMIIQRNHAKRYIIDLLRQSILSHIPPALKEAAGSERIEWK